MKTSLLLITFILGIVGCRERLPKELSLANSIVGAAPIKFTNQLPMRTLMSSVDLGSGFTATISHGYFTTDQDKDLDFLEVAIEHPISNGFHVSLMEAFALEDLPPDILKKSADQIVSQNNNSVIFDLGTVKVTTNQPKKRY